MGQRHRTGCGDRICEGGADVAINYLEEDRDARETQQLVEKHGRKWVLLRGDVGDEATCRRIVKKTVKDLGKLDILVNNASEQHPQDSIEDITAEQLERSSAPMSSAISS